MNNLRISRRTILRGLGATVALPLLEAMVPSRALAGTEETKPPLRMAFVYVPNGVQMPDWTPATAGGEYQLPPILQPLQAVKKDLLVLSGLTLDKARAHGDGGGDHARAMAAFLTGKHPRKTNGADLRGHLRGSGRRRALWAKPPASPPWKSAAKEVKTQAPATTVTAALIKRTSAWRGEQAPVAKEIDPRLIFERLFGGSSQREDGPAQTSRPSDERSILDFVMEDAARLRPRLGGSDRRKLDEYLTGIREVEQRLARNDPVVEVGQSRYRRPAGIPSEFGGHARLLSDLLVLAFQADLTRIATFVFGNDGSNRSHREIGVPEGHHDLSHHGGDAQKQAKVREVNKLHVREFAYLLKKLTATPDGTGSLLDHSMILYGSGISDGNVHNHDNLPILLAGKANGTLKTGRHVRYPKETPLTNLYVSMLDRMEAPVDAFGDSTGNLTGLSRLVAPAQE